MKNRRAQTAKVNKPGKVMRRYYWLEWISGGRIDGPYEATPFVKWKGI